MSTFRSAFSTAIIMCLLVVSVFVSQIQFAAAATIPAPQDFQTYIQQRFCDRFAAFLVKHPFALKTPAFCSNVVSKPTVDLSVTPQVITAGQSSNLSWSSSGAESCTATDGWSGSKSLNGIESISPATTTTYVLSCTNGGGTTSDSVTVTVNPVPAQPTLAFSGNPMTIMSGSSTELVWSSTGTVTCAASGGWSGSKGVSGSQSVSPSTSTNFGLICTGDGGSISGTTTITVVQPSAPTITFSASPSAIQNGSTSTLSWSSSGASSCIASQGWSGAKSLSGILIVSPSTTTVYVIDCAGLGGNAQATTTLVVNPAPAPVITFSANPSAIDISATSTISWSTTNATECVAVQGWGGSHPPSGSQVVSPSTTTVYSIDCTGLGGTTHATTTVTVNPFPEPTVSLSVNPSVIFNGATSTLTWSTANALICTASLGWSGSTSTFGSLIVSPSTTTVYVLDCSGNGGEAQASTTVTVVPAPTAKPSIVFSANPTSIVSGATSTLVWSSSDATSCTASAGWSGSKGLSDSLIVSPTTTTDYVLNCAGSGGSATATTTVTVTAQVMQTALISSSALVSGSSANAAVAPTTEGSVGTAPGSTEVTGGSESGAHIQHAEHAVHTHSSRGH